MKKKQLFSLIMAFTMVGFVACNNDNTTTASTDSTTTTTANTGTSTTTNTSSNDYSAYADDIEKNSQSGYYLNPRTGKPLKLKVNRTTGEVTDETTSEPVWRYVDNRNWWVYGVDDSDWTWDKMGEAKMDNGNLVYMGDDGKWVSYDQRWKTSDETIGKTWKTKSGDTKIKFGKDGDIKVKDESGKTKYNADNDKVKTDSTK